MYLISLHKFCFVLLLFQLLIFASFGKATFSQKDTIPPYEGKIPLINTLSQYLFNTTLDTNTALIDLKEYIPTVKLNIAYADLANFTHTKMYSLARAYLRKPSATALLEASKELEKKGLGFIIYDAYRPYSVTVRFYTLIHDTRYVASPKLGSKHNRGLSVDLGLYFLKSGIALEMPTAFDDFSEKAASNYPNLSYTARANRKTLTDLMIKYGFKPLKTEWWHFDYLDSHDYNPLDISFEDLENIKGK